MVQDKLCSEHNNTFIFEQNCFDFIRYFAAFSVMCLHYTGYSLMLCNNAIPFMKILRFIANFFPGVVVLFALSGYLVSASLERSKNKKVFFKKRILRMYPELWCCTLFNFFIIILLASPISWREMLIWLFTQFFGIANTPACLKTFATGSVNGALWTIFTEIQLYLCLYFFSSIIKKLSKIQWGVFLVIALIINLICYYISNVNTLLDKIIERSFLPYAIWFFIGSFLFYHTDILIKLRKYLIPFIAAYSLLRLIPMDIPGYYTNVFVSILCPVIVILLGYALPKIRLSNDISYGLFLYHWIVLNIIVYFDLWNHISWFLCFILFLLSTVVLAWISRYLTKRKHLTF